MKRILLVEDNHEYREMLANILEDNGYKVDAVENGLIGIEYTTLNKYDLIISDLMMGVIDGIQFISHIKKDNPNIKTIILTAEPTMDSELHALNVNVDKYLLKETRMDVLLKHIESLINREYVEIKARDNVYVSKEDNIIMDVAGRKVTVNGEEVFLTLKEFMVLELLLANQGVALKREDFLDALWDENEEVVDERIIDSYIKKLRRKLGVQRIMSVRGYGYKWDS